MNLLSKIENENINLSKIKLKGEEIWVFLRVKYYFSFLGKKQNWKPNKQGNIKKKLHYLSTMFYGFNNWFRNYNYIIFSDSSQRKLIDGKYQDKLTEYIWEKLDGNTLFIELPNIHHKNIDTVKSNNIVSRIPIVALINLLKFFLPKYKHREIDDVEDKYNLKNNYTKWLQEFFAGITVYKILFGIYKPKAIVVTNYYYNIDVIISAKKQGIKVIETQHGVIGNSHFAFNINQSYSGDYFPDTMLLFGNDDKAIIDKKGLVGKSYSVGHYYIDYINNGFNKTKKWIDLLSRYKKSIAVSLQLESGKLILDFIKTVALQKKDFVFLIAVRQDFQREILDQIPENILFPSDLDCYQIIKHCDFHSSIYSTCVQESLALGKINILIDLDNIAKKYYSHLPNTFIVDYKNHNKYIKTIEETVIINPDIVKDSMRLYIEPNYTKNIDALFDTEVFNKKIKEWE